jgi:hypothetical protein
MEHNGENGYHMSEINHFKVLLLCKFYGRLCWMDADVARSEWMLMWISYILRELV